MLPRDVPTLKSRLTRVGSAEWLFYLWVPVGIGVFMGATQPGRAAVWPLGHSLAYWVFVNCLDWWLVDLGCRAARHLLKPWRPPLLVILLFGGIAASVLLVGPAQSAVVAGWYQLLPPEVPRAPLPRWTDWGPAGILPGLMTWVTANYAFLHFGGLARYGIEPPGAAGRAGAVPALPVFLGKVRPERRGELLALNAQGHYLRVITTRGEDLILHSFGDAVDELGDEAGLRVHRSWWVSRRALEDCELPSSKRLLLAGGLEIPVSRSFRVQLLGEVEAHGAPRAGH